MTILKKLANVHVLQAYAELYSENRSIKDILGAANSSGLLTLLSILSFAREAEGKFRNWAVFNLPVFQGKKKYGESHVVYGRLQILRCWKALLTQAINSQADPADDKSLSAVLHELLLKMGVDEEIENEHQFLIQSAIHYSRDNPLLKYHRAQEIFVHGKAISAYVEIFQNLHNFRIEDYINIVYSVINRCHRVSADWPFSLENSSVWTIDLQKIRSDTKISIDLLRAVMSAISFTVEEGRDFSVRHARRDDFSLFRDRPFLKISEDLYLPIEGKFVEELLFDGLFHKVHLASGKSKKFLTHFGTDFEHYVQELVGDFCRINKAIDYKYIPEFKFGKSAERSPDAMILCGMNRSIVAVEVKSARYLDTLVSSENTPHSIRDSLDKLKYRPWEQLYDAVSKIVEKKAHPEVVEGLSYLLICVTMNEIPLSFDNHKIEVSGQDISDRFYSMGINAFEVLLIVANRTQEYTLYDILMNAYAHRDTMSIKTMVARFEKKLTQESAFFRAIFERSCERQRNYFEQQL